MNDGSEAVTVCDRENRVATLETMNGRWAEAMERLRAAHERRYPGQPFPACIACEAYAEWYATHADANYWVHGWDFCEIVRAVLPRSRRCGICGTRTD